MSLDPRQHRGQGDKQGVPVPLTGGETQRVLPRVPLEVADIAPCHVLSCIALGARYHQGHWGEGHC
jgi:hypothetical protein